MSLVIPGQFRTGLRIGTIPVCPWSYQLSLGLGPVGLYTYKDILAGHLRTGTSGGHPRVLYVHSHLQ